jgi:hypothetical protein
LAINGCSRSRDRIESYEVPRTTVTKADESSGPDRMLGAIIPLTSQGWFFKVAGPADEVEKVASQLDQLVRSVQLSDDANSAGDRLTWKLPEGWTERPETGMRMATFVAPEAPQLDISLTALPMLANDKTDYVLQNVLRWRAQMKLPPISAIDLPESTEQFRVGQLQVTWVDLRGHFEGSGPMARSGGGGPAPPQTSADAEQIVAVPEFEAPEGWQPGRMTSMRRAAFVVSEGEQQVEITLIDLAAAAGDVLANVNRWRDQVGLKPLTLQELPAHVEQIQVDGHLSNFVELVGTAADGTPTTILGAIVPASGAILDRVWFVKLTGSTRLAEREKERFLEFVRSLKF